MWNTSFTFCILKLTKTKGKGAGEMIKNQVGFFTFIILTVRTVLTY